MYLKIHKMPIGLSQPGECYRRLEGSFLRRQGHGFISMELLSPSIEPSNCSTLRTDNFFVFQCINTLSWYTIMVAISDPNPNIVSMLQSELNQLPQQSAELERNRRYLSLWKTSLALSRFPDNSMQYASSEPTLKRQRSSLNYVM